MRIGVLALQGDFREHAAMVARLGAEPALVRTPADLADLDALIIPGGESTTIGRLAERYELVEPLRDLIREGLPTLGTCAGMIFLASGTDRGRPQTQLGVLDIVVERNAFGRQVDSFEADVDVEDWERPVPGVFIRAPLVSKVGAEVEVLARVGDRPVMVQEGNIIATAFHPELTDDDRVHRALMEMQEK